MSDSIYKEAAFEEVNFYRLMSSAVFGAGAYIYPTDADIAEAGPEWKPVLPKIELDSMGGIDFFIFDEVELPTAPLPKMEVEELEVINIDLSDYPLPENPTTYDWWWA